MDDKRRIRFITFNFFIFFISIYLLTGSGVSIYNTDASVLKYEVTRSLVDKLDLSIYNDDVPGIIGADGRSYSWFGIGQSLLAVPFYSVAKSLGANSEIAFDITNQLISAATAVLIFYFSIQLGFTKHASALTTIFYGIGTIAWPMAKQPFDHVAETFFVLLSVYYMHRYINNNKSAYLLNSSVSIGFALITRQTTVLVIPPIFVMLAIHHLRVLDIRSFFKIIGRDSILFFIALIPFIGLNLWYNHYRFGSIFETGYQLIAARTGMDFFSGNSLLTGLAGFLISPGKGFFYYSPIAILFIFSIKHFAKKHIELFICFSLIMVSYLIFLSKNIFWHGDWAWGPRYLLVLTPFFIIPTSTLIESILTTKKKILKVVLCVVFCTSLLVQLSAITVNFNKYFQNLIINEKVRFIQASGYGAPPILEPPPETYFDCKRSPILAQFSFIDEITKNIKNYRYSEPPKEEAIHEIIKASPYMNIFDFWWLYIYFTKGDDFGFVVAFMLFACTIVAAMRLWKLLQVGAVL